MFQSLLVFVGASLRLLGVWNRQLSLSASPQPGRVLSRGRKDVCTGDISREGQGFPLTVKALMQVSWLVGFLVLFSFRICFYNSHLDKNAGSKGTRVCSLDSTLCEESSVRVKTTLL